MEVTNVRVEPDCDPKDSPVIGLTRRRAVFLPQPGRQRSNHPRVLQRYALAVAHLRFCNGCSWLLDGCSGKKANEINKVARLLKNGCSGLLMGDFRMVARRLLIAESQ